MMKAFPELPGWTFEINEVSVGVYEVIVRDGRKSQRFSSKDVDAEALMKACYQQAVELAQRR